MQLTPSNTDLGDLMEQEAVDVKFIAVPDNTEQVTEQVKMITIVPSESISGITIDDNHLYGTYNNVFTLGPDSLKYRLNDEFKNASSWDELPTDKSAELYLWKAPKNLRKTITYTVTVLYTETTKSDQGSSGGSSGNSGGDTEPPVVVEKELVRVYTQEIVGNYSIWAQKLRDYVYARP